MARTTPVNSGYNILNGASTGANAAGVDCWLEWKVLSQDVTANTSSLRVILYAAARISSSTAWNGAENFGYVAVDGGTKQYLSATYDFSGNRVNKFADYTFTVRHGVDGAKSARLEGAWATSHSSYISGGSVSGTVQLPTIARASTVAATSAYIGKASTVTVSKRNSGYTHSIAYAFGSLSGYLTAAGGTSASEVKFSDSTVLFTIPTAFYSAMPNAASAVCTLTCKTYSGGAQIGAAQTCNFLVSADPALCAPTVTGTVVDSNRATVALTGDSGILIRGCSTALCTISASPRNGATLRGKGINGTVITQNTLTIPNVSTGDFLFTALDSRGFSGQAAVQKTLIPYVRLTCNPVCRRVDPASGEATLTVDGGYFDGSFGAVSNTLTLQYRVDGGEAVPISPQIIDGGYKATAALTGLDYRTAHTIEVTAEDKLGAVTKSVSVSKGLPVFDWGEEDFNFNVPVSAPGFAGEAKSYIDAAFSRPMATLSDTIDRYDLPGGIYRVGRDAAGSPTAGSEGILLHFGGYNQNTYNLQLFVAIEHSDSVYIRHKWYYYGWRSWIQLA